MQCDILKHFTKKKKRDRPNQPMDSPLQVQLIKFLGLKNYFVDKFIFRRKQSKYELARLNNRNCILLPRPYQPPPQLEVTVKLLQSSGSSTPILLLKHKQPHDNFIIIYSHGNSSDLSDGLGFLEALALHFQIDVLGYDYSGYGESRVPVIGEETIVRDLGLILAWLDRPLRKVILWGFSLGSYPTVCNAGVYGEVGGMVLQCPIASINCMFEKELTTHLKFREDHFSNLDRVTNVKSLTFIVHSVEDQIIPISHARVLFEKFTQANGRDKIWFLEVNKLHHNAIHKYFVSRSDNDLKAEFREFLREVRKRKGQNTNTTTGEDKKRLQDKARVMEAELDEMDQFDEDNYELTAISGSREVVKPGKRFGENKRILPKCFSYE